MDSAYSETTLTPGRWASIAAFALCCVGAVTVLNLWRYGYLSNLTYWPVWGVFVAGGIASLVMERHYRLGQDDRHRGRGFDVLPKKEEDDDENP